jgi:glutamate--cysteine ligase
MIPGATISDPVRATVAGLFEPGAYAGPPRTGIELEVLPIRASDGGAVPPRPTPGGGPATLPVLRRIAERHRWREEEGSAGLPRFAPEVGGWISYEPGGQIEYSSPPSSHLPTLQDRLTRVAGPLEAGMAEAEIRLLARGCDPTNSVADARLFLEGDRYPRQRAHYDRRSPLGRVMMLQSAAVHLNVDLGPRPFEVWRAANRLAPLLIALFANSPVRCGASTPHRSQRSALWRVLDPTRTGVFGGMPETDPVAEYEEFALTAESFLLGPPDQPGRPFRAWLDEGATLDDWRRHLTTLFPEVRPRGYLEIRCLDALPLRWAVVAAAVTVSLLHGEGARTEVLDRLPPATTARLERAGRLGVTDPGLRAEVLSLEGLVQRGLDELGEEVSDAALRASVSEFFGAFPARGLDPGTAPESWVGS